MRRPDGSPWDLKRAAASPLERDYPPPGTEKAGADWARYLFEHRHEGGAA